jgi:hypothetical protein
MSERGVAREGKVGPGPNRPDHPAREDEDQARTVSTNGIAVGGLIAALVAVVLALFVPIPGFILAFIAVVASWSGYSRGTMGAPHRGLALGGVIAGGAAMALSVVGFFGIFSLVNGSA